jgi:HlyD family secretion protein
MTGKKLWIGLGVVVVLGALAYVNIVYRTTDTVPVTAESITRRDLQAIVSASGKIQPKHQVNVSAETMGKVVGLMVAEGDTVTKGQPLLQIDPRNLQTTVQNREASLATARSQLDQTRSQVENTKVALKQSQDTLRRQEGLYKQGLLSRDEYERAQNDLKMRETDLLVSQQSVEAQVQRIRQEEANLESARHDLSKVEIVAPLSGLVTSRNVEVGETAVVGTMNNAGTVLLTIADMSVIETEIEVDETDVPFVQIGQPATVSIDALPDRTFAGHVTEVGNSPTSATTGASSSSSSGATNFKVVVTLDEKVPGVRPGFTCTAEITTATRQQALSVPIQAMTVREMIVDSEGQIVKPTVVPGSRAAADANTGDQPLEPGQTRKEIEGVFVIRDGKAQFTPVKTGIAGEKYFEALSGLKAGDQVITGPFASVRNLKDGDAVKITTTPVASGASSTT